MLEFKCQTEISGYLCIFCSVSISESSAYENSTTTTGTCGAVFLNVTYPRSIVLKISTYFNLVNPTIHEENPTYLISPISNYDGSCKDTNPASV